MEMPSCTQRSKNSGVVISRSVGRRFFRLHIGLHIQAPQFNELRQHLVDGYPRKKAARFFMLDGFLRNVIALIKFFCGCRLRKALILQRS